MKSNSYSDKFSTKTNPRMVAQKKGHANPSSAHSTRKMSTVKQPSGSAKSKRGLQGLSIGQRVPMKMFSPNYNKPNAHGMAQVQEANTFKKKTKKSLSGKQKQFFGL